MLNAGSACGWMNGWGDVPEICIGVKQWDFLVLTLLIVVTLFAFSFDFKTH